MKKTQRKPSSKHARKPRKPQKLSGRGSTTKKDAGSTTPLPISHAQETNLLLRAIGKAILTPLNYSVTGELIRQEIDAIPVGSRETMARSKMCTYCGGSGELCDCCDNPADACDCDADSGAEQIECRHCNGKGEIIS